MTTMTEQATQVYSVFIRATPEQVWDAITKPEFTTRFTSTGPGSSRRSSPERRT